MTIAFLLVTGIGATLAGVLGPWSHVTRVSLVVIGILNLSVGLLEGRLAHRAFTKRFWSENPNRRPPSS